MANLNGKQIVEQGIVTKVVNEECIQQVGVDLELIAVEQILGHGIVPNGKQKTQLPNKVVVALGDIPVVDGSNQTTKGWLLHPGSYDITLAQGCKIPANQRLQIVQRSSMLRNGVILASSMFDPGFETENVGTVMHVSVPIFIQQNARVAQAYTTEVNPVDEKDLYNGQWQNDKQREQK